MALRGEVDNSVNRIFGHHAVNQRRIADVALDKHNVTALLERRQTCAVSCVGQRIQDNKLIVRAGVGPVVDEVHANEPRAPGDHE